MKTAKAVKLECRSKANKSCWQYFSVFIHWHIEIALSECAGWAMHCWCITVVTRNAEIIITVSVELMMSGALWLLLSIMFYLVIILYEIAFEFVISLPDLFKYKGCFRLSLQPTIMVMSTFSAKAGTKTDVLSTMSLTAKLVTKTALCGKQRLYRQKGFPQ